MPGLIPANGRVSPPFGSIVAIGNIVRRQAFIMAFSDTFFLMGVALVAALAATLMLRKPGQMAAGGAH